MTDNKQNIESMILDAKHNIEASMKELYPSMSSLGGKKLRGSLAVIIANEFGGDRTKALRYGSAVEFIHAGSLFHDDVIDEHEERRGSPTSFVTDGI